MGYSSDMSSTRTRWRSLVAGLALLGLGACGWKLETRETGGGADAASEVDAAAHALAPKFSLPNDDGTIVSLDELLAAGRPAVLVFYRGHW